MPMVVILPRSGRSPFQIYLIALVMLAGIGIVFGASTNTITRAMGEPYATIWGAFLVIGGFLILLGIYWPKRTLTGLLIERSGLVALGGASLIWSILVIRKVQLDGLFSAMLTLGLFIACVAQWRWINRNINTAIRAINDNR